MTNIYTQPGEINQIATRLGLRRAGREWRGVCPSCGYGADAFILSAGRTGPVGWCASCQNADAIRAVLRADAPPQPQTPADAANAAARRALASEKAAKLWAGSETIRPGDPASKYLVRRHLASAIANPALRFRADCPHPTGAKLPALLCRIDDVEGTFRAVQRIFLDATGAKAPLVPGKAALGPIWGCAIRLGAGGEIVVAEGPETAIAAGTILGLPAWSAINAGNLETALTLPREIHSVAIAADHDAPGIRAAEAAARRWRAEGRNARIVKPLAAGQDFADVLAGRMEASR